MDNNNVTGARNLQLVDVVRRSGLQARNLMMLAEQATAPPAALGPALPAQQDGDLVASQLEDVLQQLNVEGLVRTTDAASGPAPAHQHGNGQVPPDASSDATYRGAIEVVRLECKNALRTLAQEDAAASGATAQGPPPSVQQGTVTPPARGTATAVVTNARDCSDLLLQAISNVANRPVANDNPPPMFPPTGTPGMLPPPGLLNSLGPQFFPGFYPDPFGWSMQQLPLPFFHGASLNPFSVPAMPWTMPAFHQSPYGYMPPMMPPPTPTFHGPMSASGIPPPPMPPRVLRTSTSAAPPPGSLNAGATGVPSTPDNGFRYIPSTPTPQRRTTPANGPSTPDSDVVIVSPLPPARMRCIAARRVSTAGMRTPPARRESPVSGPSSATRTPPAVDNLQALQPSCNRILGGLKASHVNAGFQPEGSSESETATTPPTGSTLVEAPSTGQRLRELLAAQSLGTPVSVRVSGIEMGRSQTIGPPGPSRSIQRTEVGCSVPAGMVQRHRALFEERPNPPTPLRAPSATYKRKGTDAPSTTAPTRNVLGGVQNQRDTSQPPPAKRQVPSLHAPEQLGNEENRAPAPAQRRVRSPAVVADRGSQTNLRLGTVGGGAEWFVRGAVGIDNSERARAEALGVAYAAAKGHDGQDASLEPLREWIRTTVLQLREIRAEPLALAYLSGIMRHFLTRPVPNIDPPRAMPYSDQQLMREVQRASKSARRPANAEYATPFLVYWILRLDTGIEGASRAARRNAPAPPSHPDSDEDQDAPSTSGQ